MVPCTPCAVKSPLIPYCANFQENDQVLALTIVTTPVGFSASQREQDLCKEAAFGLALSHTAEYSLLTAGLGLSTGDIVASRVLENDELEWSPGSVCVWHVIRLLMDECG